MADHFGTLCIEWFKHIFLSETKIRIPKTKVGSTNSDEVNTKQKKKDQVQLETKRRETKIFLIKKLQ